MNYKKIISVEEIIYWEMTSFYFINISAKKVKTNDLSDCFKDKKSW